MLGALRSSAKSWVAKILLLLLVASFAVWGISGQITGGVGGNTVLSVGDTAVSTDEYRLAYDRAFRNYQSQFGPSLTREQAQLFGIENQVISQLAAGAVLDEQARQMRLGLTKGGLAQVISEDAKNWSSGNFNRDQLRLVLRQIGMTEEDYVTTLESAAIRQQLIEATVNDVQIPKVFLDAFFGHRGESRDVTLIGFGKDNLEPIKAPDETALATYFETNKSKYRAPEYRSVNYVRLTADELADASAISDSSVADEYEATKSRYGTPEERTVQQLVFADRESAEQTRQLLLAGKNYEEVLADLGRTISDVTLGTLTREAIPDPAIAAGAFDLASINEISDVIDGAFGPVLLRVTEIKPERVQPLEEVAEAIRNELALVEANDVLLNVHDAFVDARAGGASMADAAQAQKLQMITITEVDSRGRLASGEAVTVPAELDELLQQAFQADVNAENQSIPAGRSGFLWYEVQSVTPDRDRTLDEVRQQVVADWTAAQTDMALDTMASTIEKRLSDGETVQAIVADTGFNTQKRFGLSRQSDDVELGTDGVTRVFSVGPRGVGSADAANGNGRFVFIVDAINPPLGNGESLTDADKNGISSALADDFLDQLVGRAREEFTVSVNPAAVTRAQQNL